MAILDRIAPVSALRIGFISGAVLGLVPGIFCTVIAVAGIPFRPHEHLPRFVPLFAFVLAPMFYGTVLAMLAVLLALIYNLASRWLGGLEIELNASTAAR